MMGAGYLTVNARTAAAVLFLVALVGSGSTACAQYVLEDDHDPHRYDPSTINVPIAYYSDVWKLSAGYAGYLDGTFQRQADAFTFLIGSSNGSYGGVFGMDNVQIRPIDRLFLDWNMSYFRTEEDTNYIDGNPKFTHQEAGDNHRGSDNFVASASNDFIASFTFKYLLPIGDGRERIIDYYTLSNGLLESGASGAAAFWNPLASGRSFLEVEPRCEYLQIRSGISRIRQADTNLVQLNYFYDNSDFPLTPSFGNTTTLSLLRDFGLFGSSGPWTNVTGEFAQYFPLGQSSIFRQEVLALDGWTSYTPTYSLEGQPGHEMLHGASPFYDGAVLGGMQRMRGFDEGRFHGRAGVYAAAELRLIPYWNPLNDIALFKSADIAWMQFVVFGEVGRVADEYTPRKLFSHLRTDGGAGIRILTSDTVVRFDLAGSDEGLQFWANLNQAF